MNLPLHIARRYLFATKKHHAVNIISGISACGVAFATMALVCTLSVFNGFQEMVAGLFTAFDPELKITTVKGKTFDAQSPIVAQIRALPEVELCCPTLEENVMVRYKGRQAVVTLKGVDEDFEQLTDITHILYGNGRFLLEDSIASYGVMGIELIGMLGTGLSFTEPLEVLAPKREARINPINPSSAFKRDFLYAPGVAFAVNQQSYDSKYILTSLAFMRRLLDYETEATALELKLRPGSNTAQVQAQLSALLGSEFAVQSRYEQQASVFRIMEVEKFISYLFLTFILTIASFNIIGSLSMLILDKREDVNTLRNLGASNRLISRIFLCEGCLISLLGALGGIVLGVVLCLLQQTFGFIRLGDGSGTFVVDTYPVSVHLWDVILILITVTVVGFLSVWYPVRYLSKRLL